MELRPQIEEEMLNLLNFFFKMTLKETGLFLFVVMCSPALRT